MANYAIIGANYGSEGKGLVTDWLVSKHKDQRNCVVRFNGGPQADHTVVTPDNMSFIFRHVGSGAFLGADTYLPKTFLVEPQRLAFELDYFRTSTALEVPPVKINIGARVVTPVDAHINQFLAGRGTEKKTSGIGIYETVLRSKTLPFTVKDYFDLDSEEIPEEFLDYAEERMRSCGYVVNSINLKNNWADFMRAKDRLTKPQVSFRTEVSEDEYENFFFEGAQGLLLHENYGEMPYCTPSDTSVIGVMRAADFQIKQLETYFVSRCYLTRHGDGPIGDHKLIKEVEDETNVQNQYQGKFRGAPLEVQSLCDRISQQAKLVSNFGKSHLILTHMDRPVYNMAFNGKEVINVEKIREAIEEKTPEISVRICKGRTREDVEE